MSKKDGFSKNKSGSTAIQTGNLEIEMVEAAFGEQESNYELPHYTDCIETNQRYASNSSHPDSRDFTAAKDSSCQVMPKKVIQQPVPMVKMREEVIKETDHRTGFWSAGVIHQFNGARTPPIPKKQSKQPQVIREAAVHRAAAISYEEMEIMSHEYNSGEKRNAPTDYNKALLSITQKNDDVIGSYRAQQAQIHNLMPSTNPEPSSFEPVFRPPSPPPLPKKQIKSQVNPLEHVPNMGLGRTLHSDGKLVNDYDGEIVEKVKTRL